MLVLTRRIGERFVIYLGEQVVEVEILGQKNGGVQGRDQGRPIHHRAPVGITRRDLSDDPSRN